MAKQILSSAIKQISSWTQLDPNDLSIKKCDGCSGSRTFHVIAPQHYIPSQICLHQRDDIIILQRQTIAANAFEKARLGPKVLVVGKDYWIDEWIGIGKAKVQSDDDWKECGQFLAKIHSIPTDWWDSSKAEYMKDERVANFPQGSLAWAYIQRDIWKRLPKMDKESQYRLATAITTYHPIARRIVTSHCDYHPGNIIDLGKDSDGDRFKCIDFEFTCVTHAIQDLAFGNAFCKQSKKSAFFAGYLMQLGQPVTQEAIRVLRIEAELYQLTSWIGGKLSPKRLESLKVDQIMELVDEIKKFVDHVRNSTQAQDQLLKVGLQTYINSKGNSLHDYELNKQNKQIQVAEKEADEFRQKLDDIKQSAQILLERAVWRQPADMPLPIKIGTIAELGIHQSFTALCWVKNESPSKKRKPIFMGDADLEKGKHWQKYKPKFMHMQLRQEHRFYFGLGQNDIASSNRRCRFDKWEHVAFVYKSDKECPMQKIIVNGKESENRCGADINAQIEDQTLWLGGDRKHCEIGRWVGKIEGGMTFRGFLSEAEVTMLAAATNPMRV